MKLHRGYRLYVYLCFVFTGKVPELLFQVSLSNKIMQKRAWQSTERFSDPRQKGVAIQSSLLNDEAKFERCQICSVEDFCRGNRWNHLKPHAQLQLIDGRMAQLELAWQTESLKEHRFHRL